MIRTGFPLYCFLDTGFLFAYNASVFIESCPKAGVLGQLRE
jgi:hypothetical protein